MHDALSRDNADGVGRVVNDILSAHDIPLAVQKKLDILLSTSSDVEKSRIIQSLWGNLTGRVNQAYWDIVQEEYNEGKLKLRVSSGCPDVSDEVSVELVKKARSLTVREEQALDAIRKFIYPTENLPHQRYS